ncbi:MAG: threonine-phosphate decarboxylase CobD [Planctomycetota bacterium]
MFKGHGGNIKAIRNDGSSIIDFSANINPLGYPAEVRKVLWENFDEIKHYPDIDCSALRSGIAQKVGHTEHEILVGNGSTELFYLIPRAIKPAKGVVFQPTFNEFAEALRCSGAGVIHCVLKAEEGFHFQYHSTLFEDDKVEMAFLCNPNNPTGQLVEKTVILDMVKRHPRITFVIDEAFIDFVDTPERYSVVHEASALQNLVVVRSLTKFYGFPGLRIGYLVTHGDRVEKMMAQKEPWTVNTLAQLAALAALADVEFVSRTRAFVFEEQSFLFNGLSQINGISPYQPTANYLFIKITGRNTTSPALRKQLLEYGIAIRDCSNFVGLDDTYFRVAVRTREENTRLIDALKDAVRLWR